MNDDEAIARLKRYESIVSQNIGRFVHYSYTREREAPRVKAVYLEALAILDGDEEKFKRCLQLAKAPKNWVDFTDSIDDVLASVKCYARILK